MAEVVSHGQNPIGLKTGRNDLVRSPRVFRSFPRVLELKMGVLGLGFYLARKLGLYRAQGRFQVKPQTDLDTDKILLFELLKAITFYP